MSKKIHGGKYLLTYYIINPALADPILERQECARVGNVVVTAFCLRAAMRRSGASLC